MLLGKRCKCQAQDERSKKMFHKKFFKESKELGFNFIIKLVKIMLAMIQPIFLSQAMLPDFSLTFTNFSGCY
jgi:hypothetical protein